MTDSDKLQTENEQDQLYRVLGEAITKWAEIEEVLFEMVAAILGSSREHAAIVFYRINSLDQRIALTSELMETIFPRTKPGDQDDPDWVTWKDLRKRLKKAVPTRNRLAHHPVGPYIEIHESTDSTRVTHRFEVRIASSMSSAEQLRKGDEFSPLGTEEIKQHILLVSNYVTMLRNFRRREFSRRLPKRA